MSTFTVANSEEAFLGEQDSTAVSFWIISIAMIAVTVFFHAGAETVGSHWDILQWETMNKQKKPIINQKDRGRRRKWQSGSQKVRTTQKVANRKQTG